MLVFAITLQSQANMLRLCISAIIASGLVALVDDCIRRRWHAERPRILPARSSFSRGLERMGPRRLIGEMLQRRGSA